MDSSVLEFVDVSLQANVGIGLMLERASFEIAPQTRVAIVGPSGAGKTSLLRLMNRLSEPTSGVIRYRQRPLSSYGVVQLRQHIGLVLQEPSLLGQSVEEALCYPARLKGIDAVAARQNIQPWLERLKIPQAWLPRHATELSVGQRQRVAIARTLSTEPDVILLDEPTAAQDVGYASYLLAYLTRAQSISTVVMVNHQLDLMVDWATHVMHLHQGHLITYQSVEKIDWVSLKNSILAAQKEDDWNQDWDD